MHLLLTIELGPQSHADTAAAVFDGGHIKDHFSGAVFLTILYDLKADTKVFRSGQEAAADIPTGREGSLDVDNFVVGDIDDAVGVLAHS